jgi:hypothetical protein
VRFEDAIAKRLIEEALGDSGEDDATEPLGEDGGGGGELQRVFNADTRRRPARTVDSRKSENATRSALACWGGVLRAYVREPLYGIEP